MAYRQFLVALTGAMLVIAADAAENTKEQDKWDANAPPGNSRQIDINTETVTGTRQTEPFYWQLEKGNPDPQ